MGVILTDKRENVKRRVIFLFFWRKTLPYNMPVQVSDIKYFKSSHTVNDVTSLGGSINLLAEIPNTIDNLFDSVTGEGASTSYRCFFVYNDNGTSTFNQARVWIGSQVSGGGTIEIGVGTTNHIQSLTFTGSLSSGTTSGTFKLSYNGDETNSITWNDNVSILATAIETELQAVNSILSGVVVSGQETVVDTTKVFTINFNDDSGGRWHPNILVSENLLTPSVSTNVLSTQAGRPINIDAVTIADEETPPAGITFTTPASFVDSISIGKLFPDDNFSIWAKRTIPSNTSPLSGDGFTIIVRGRTDP